MLSVYAPILYCTFARSEEPLGWIQDRADLISNSFMVVPSKTYRIMGFALYHVEPFSTPKQLRQAPRRSNIHL